MEAQNTEEEENNDPIEAQNTEEEEEEENSDPIEAQNTEEEENNDPIEAQNTEERANVHDNFTLRFFCEGHGMFQKVFTNQGSCFFGQAVREMGRLFLERNIILILTFPKTGTRIQYNKSRNVLNHSIPSNDALINETYQGNLPIYVYSEPMPNPVQVIRAGEKPQTVYISKDETISSLIDSHGFGPGTICIHNKTLLSGDQTAETARIFDHHPIYLTLPGYHLITIKENSTSLLNIKMNLYSTIFQLKEEISHRRSYLRPEMNYMKMFLIIITTTIIIITIIIIIFQMKIKHLNMIFFILNY